MIKLYYIFDIKEGYDDVHGDIIIVRAGIVHNNMVSEFGKDINATIHKVDIDSINSTLFK